MSTDGIVAVKWRIDEGRLEMTWTERGGPLCVEPPRNGFGTLMVQRMLADQFVESSSSNTSRKAWYSDSSYLRPIFVRSQSNRTKTRRAKADTAHVILRNFSVAISSSWTENLSPRSFIDAS